MDITKGSGAEEKNGNSANENTGITNQISGSFGELSKILGDDYDREDSILTV